MLNLYFVRNKQNWDFVFILLVFFTNAEKILLCQLFPELYFPYTATSHWCRLQFQSFMWCCNIQRIYLNKGFAASQINFSKLFETFLSIYDLILLSFTNEKSHLREEEHLLIKEEINLDERIWLRYFASLWTNACIV